MIPERERASLHDAVYNLLLDVSANIVLPRYRRLGAGEISEKSPGEVVTSADRDVELVLSAALGRLVPGSRCVGEEATAADPRLLTNLADGAVWLIDPIDGTSNYASGEGPFGTMIALTLDGVVEAAWLYDPVRLRLCHAVRGVGSFINNRRATVPVMVPRRPVAALATQFMPAALADAMREQARQAFAVVPIPRCAAEHYPRLVLGENDIALFHRTLPWDHAAGALFLTEAGGAVTRWDGSPYRFADDVLGLIAAGNMTLANAARAVLFGHEDVFFHLPRITL